LSDLRSAIPPLIMEKIQHVIRDYIVSSFLESADAAALRDDDDLLMVLDSLQILRLLMDLETRYSIKVDNSELSPDNLGTVEKLAAFVARKRQEAAC
jgi:acyl carrier protein